MSGQKELIKKFKQDLEGKKLALEKELKSFATKDKNIKDNWDVKRTIIEDADMEEKADEIEEYDNLLSLEHSLELKLKEVNLAIEKIENGKYGKCEKCGKAIEEERLKAYPEAKLCMKCNK